MLSIQLSLIIFIRIENVSTGWFFLSKYCWCNCCICDSLLLLIKFMLHCRSSLFLQQFSFCVSLVSLMPCGPGCAMAILFDYGALLLLICFNLSTSCLISKRDCHLVWMLRAKKHLIVSSCVSLFILLRVTYVSTKLMFTVDDQVWNTLLKLV